MDHPLSRALVTTNYVDLGNGTVCIQKGQCVCEAWLKSKGTSGEAKAAFALQWMTFSLALSCIIWYAYQTWRATCGWEEFYVAVLEMVKFVIEAFHEFDSPATLWLSTGNAVAWLRYGEWLLTCPVILIHLSNLTGLKDDYSKRTMGLLVSDVGCIVWGATAAMSHGWVRILFFLIALCYGLYTYFHAAKVYIESYHTVPKGICRDLVRLMAWVFFCSWAMFPVLFMLGPEGFGHISHYGSAVAHAILDIISKNVWGLIGNYLRVKIHEHILLYGDIRKRQVINVAGQDMEVETLVVEEDDETYKQSTAKYASRESFTIMRDRLKKKGYEIRASLDGNPSSPEAENPGPAGGPRSPTGAKVASGWETGKMGAGAGMGMAGMGGSTLEPGRVILAVPDISMVEFFRENFAQLSVPYEVVPALGADVTVQLVQQAAMLGGCDFVLMHPEYLRDRGPMGLLQRLRMMGQRVAAFGWAPLAPERELIESAGLDGWLEGPKFGVGINPVALQQLVLKMQASRRSGSLMPPSMAMAASPNGFVTGHGNGVGVNRAAGGIMMTSQGNPGMGMGAGMAAIGSGISYNNMAAANMAFGAAGGGGAVNTSGRQGTHSQLVVPQGMGMGMAGASTIGTNPLYGAPQTPLSSQPGISPGGAPNNALMTQLMPGGSGPMPITSGNRVAGSAPSFSGAAANGGDYASGGEGGSEAEMLQQLMAEINRLKTELGE